MFVWCTQPKKFNYFIFRCCSQTKKSTEKKTKVTSDPITVKIYGKENKNKTRKKNERNDFDKIRMCINSIHIP